MPGSAAIHASLLYGFLLVLARISGIFVFLPLPGLQAGPNAAKITLAMGLTIALCSRWTIAQPAPQSMVQLTGWMLVEAAIGLATGLAVAFVIEGFIVAAQAISTQAGFAYASTVDPNTEADSTVLIQIAQLTAGLLFFAMGFDRQLLSTLSRSLETHPPGSFTASRCEYRRPGYARFGCFFDWNPASASAYDPAVPDRLVRGTSGPCQLAAPIDRSGFSRENSGCSGGLELSRAVDSKTLSAVGRNGF